LIEEVLNELFLQRPRGKEAMKIGAEEFCDEVTMNNMSTFFIERI
jgi:hypothetical protein